MLLCCVDQVFGYAWPEGADAGSGSTAPCRRVIILEEDLEVASDFFVYFRALERLLDEDASLLGTSCVLAFMSMLVFGSLFR